MKGKNRIYKILSGIAVFLMLTGFLSNSYGATLVRTVSNTIRFTEDYSTGEYIDATSRNTYLIQELTGSVRNTASYVFCWDGPTVAIDVDDTRGYIYTISEMGVHSKMLADPPFSSTSGRFRFDLYVMKYDVSGNAKWSQSVRVRNDSDDNVYYDDGNSRYPRITVDEATGDTYVGWLRRNSAGTWQVMLQKIAADGSKPWGTEKIIATVNSTYSADVAVSGSYVYITYKSGNNVRAAQVNTSTGAIVTDVQVNAATHSTAYSPKMKLGPDGALYVVWVDSAINIYGQRLNTSLTRVNWNGSTTDKVLNKSSGYFYTGSFWYGWSEFEANFDFDSSTNMYVIWSAGLGGDFTTFAQKINCYNAGFTQMWGGVGSDVMLASSANGNVYADIAIGNGVGYVSYITHDSGENDYGMLMKLNLSDGSAAWGSRIYAGISHHMRIACFDNDKKLYVSGYGLNLRKYDEFGTYLYGRNYRDRLYMTRFYYGSPTIIPGTITKASIDLENTTYQSGAFYNFWISPDGGTSIYGPLQISNGTGQVTFSSISNLGNDFRMYIVADNNANSGYNYISLNQLSVEATEIALGDMLVGKAPDGSDAIGDMVINSDSSGQAINTYVYNNGTSAASAFFFIKNNGNVSNDFQLTATGGNADWTVKYWLCDENGNTNLNITSSILGGLVTNLQSFNSNEWMIVRAYLTPSVSLSPGDSYAVTIQVAGDTGAGYSFHDQATINAVVSAALPDLIIDGKEYSIGYDIRNGDGSGQNALQIGETNVERVYMVHLRNAGGSDSIKITATNGTSANWQVNYYTNGVDVTAQICNTGVGISNYLVNEGYYSNLEVRIRPTAACPQNSQLTLPITAVSYQAADKLDVVVAKYIRVRAKSDLIAQSKGYAIYNPTLLATQLYTNYSDNNLTNNYTLVLSNSGSYAMDFRMSGVLSSGLNSEWKVYCYDGTSNITYPLTNSYYTVSGLASGSVHNFQVRIITPQTHNAGANEDMAVTFTAKAEGNYNNNSFWDVAGMSHRTVSSRVDDTVDGLSYGVWESTPSTQYVFKYVFDSTNFTIKVSNSAASAYNIQTTAISPDFGFNVAYSNAGSDITAALEGSGWTTAYTAGQEKTINVLVSVDWADIGDTYEATLSSESAVNSSDVDSIKFKVERAVAPDMLVRKGIWSFDYFKGDNQYSLDPVGSDQGVSSEYPQGKSSWYQYVFKVQNDRLVAETNRLTATLSQPGWEATFWRYIGSTPSNPDLSNPPDWNEVTASITGSGYVIPSLAPGSETVFKLEARPSSATNEGDSVNIDVTSLGLTTQFRDRIRVSLTYGIGIPDLVYSQGVSQSTNWDDIYVTDYTQAVATNYVDKAKGTWMKYVVENDSMSNNSSPVIRGNDGDTSGWNIRYYDSSTNDITASVIADGYSPPASILPLSNISLLVKVDAANSQKDLGEYTNVNIKVSSESNELQDYLRIVTILTDIGRPDIVLGNNYNGTYTSVTNPTLGTNIYIGWGDTVSVPVVIQNDRSVSEQLKLYASGNLSYWTIRYYTNTVEVTSSITNNFFSGQPYLDGWDVTVPGNGSITLTAKVSLASNCNYSLGENRSFYIYAYSEGRRVRDGARIYAQVYDYGLPDIASPSQPTWDTIRETTPSSQIALTNTEKGWYHDSIIYLKNERSQNELMKLKGSGKSGNWDIQYAYNVSGSSWSNITAGMTNSYYSLLIPSMSTITLRLESFIDRTATNVLDSTYSVDVQLLSWMSFVTDTVRTTYTIKDLAEPDLKLTNGLWNDVYSAIPGDYTTNLQIEKGETQIFYLYLQNDSSLRTNEFILEAAKPASSWSVTYDIWDIGLGWLARTYEVENGESLGGQAVLPPSEQLLTRVTVSAVSNMPTNTILNLDLYMKSEFGIQSDVGRIALTYVDKGNPDVVFGAARSGNGVKENPASFVQVSNINIEYGDKITIPVYLQNDRTDKNEIMQFKGNYKTHDDFLLQYLMLSNGGTNNITGDVISNRFQVLVPMSSEVTVFVSMNLVSNSILSTNQESQYMNMSLISFGTVITDSLNLNYHVADLAQPNIYLAGDDTWSNTIEFPANWQYSNVTVEIGHTNIINYYIENGRSKNEEFDYQATGARANWELNHYYWNGSWQNVNNEVTNNWTNVINANSRKQMRAVLYVPYDHEESFTHDLGDSLDLTLLMKSWMGFVWDQGRLHYVLQDLGSPNILKDSGSSWLTVSSDPSDQQAAINIEKGVSNSIELQLTNMRSTYDKFFLQANVIEWNTRYYISTTTGWSNITELITNGMYVDFTNSEIKNLLIRNYADLGDTNEELTTRNIYVWLKSYKDQTKDVVRLQYILKDLSTPDIIFEGSFSNVFSWQHQSQSVDIPIEKGETLNYNLKYRNAIDRVYNYVLAATPHDTNWTMSYSLSNSGVLTNITWAMTNGGFTNLFTTNQSKYGGWQISLISNSQLSTNDTFVDVIQMFSLAKLKIEELTANLKVVDRGNPLIRLTNGLATTRFLKQKEQVTNLHFLISNRRTDTRFTQEKMWFKLEPTYFAQWDYELYMGSSNIVALATNGGFPVILPNGGSTNLLLTVTILASNTNAAGSTNTVLVKALSQGKERVAVATTEIVKQEPRPDLTVVSVSGAGLVGDNIYGSYTNQTLTGYVIVNLAATYSIIIENDDVIDDNIVVKIEGDVFTTNRWVVGVVDDDYQIDVTYEMAVTNITNMIPAGSSKMYILSVAAGEAVKMNETNSVYFTVWSLSDTNKRDVIRVNSIRVPVTVSGYIYSRRGQPLKDATFELKSKFSDDKVQGTTDENGKYQVQAVPGTYDVVGKCYGYVDYSGIVTVKEVQVFEIDDIVLLPVNLDMTTFNAHTFPNPVVEREAITILVNHLNGGLLRVQVYDIQGKLLKTFYDEEMNSGVYTIDWDARDSTGKYLSRGVYMLMIYDGVEMKIKKIFIQ